MPLINFRVTDQQRDYLHAKAEEAGLDVSTYIRRALAIDQGDILARLEELEETVKWLKG